MEPILLSKMCFQNMKAMTKIDMELDQVQNEKCDTMKLISYHERGKEVVSMR